MAVPTHFKFTFRGKFNLTPEIWSFGVKFRRDVPAESDADLSNIDEGAVEAAVEAFFGTNSVDSGCHLVDWRAYMIGTDGKMQGNGPLLHVVDADTVNGTGSPIYPPQIATCVTLVADNRGPAKLGRFYLPPPSYAIANDRRLSDSQATQIASDVSDFLKGISGAIDLPTTIESSPCINVSPRGGVGGTKQDVDHVEVGHVLDTIRTRRNQLVEARIVGGQIDW